MHRFTPAVIVIAIACLSLPAGASPPFSQSDPLPPEPAGLTANPGTEPGAVTLRWQAFSDARY